MTAPFAAPVPERVDPAPTLTALNALSDPDADVRYYVLRSLEHAGPIAKAAVPALIKMLRDENPNGRLYTAEALAAIGPDAKGAVIVPGI